MTRPDGGLAPGLRINELCADDDGFQIDEVGQADDWVELVNAGPTPLDLRRFSLAVGNATPKALPTLTLRPGEVVLLYLDDSPEQGPRHMPFRLPAKGGRVTLGDRAGVVDEVRYPALVTNEAFGRYPDPAAELQRCRFASPGRPNGPRCGPPPAPAPPDEVKFASFTWPAGWGAPAGPLVIDEIAAFPARFVEVRNASAQPAALADFELRLAPHAPGAPWPVGGQVLPWPRTGTLGPGERLAVPLAPELLAEVVARPEREGVLALAKLGSHALADRVDFMRVPDGAVLARVADAANLTLCGEATPGAAHTTCNPVSRLVGDRLRHARTPEDMAALAAGGTELDAQAVKFVIDMEAGGVVHLISTKAWPLHYGFIRERIFNEPRLDRCDPGEAPIFDVAWRAFSDKEYFATEGRRFLLGTLVRYGGSGAQAVEFDRGDLITAAQMRRAFFTIAAHLPDPRGWAVRPQGARQIQALKSIEGTLPLMDPHAPFRGLKYQAITPGVGFGILRFMPAAELAEAKLGLDAIVVTDDVPLDVPFLGGLITEAFQTPLSHVAVLTRNRATPDMALPNARQDPRVAPLIGKLVRLEVSGAGFSLREAQPAEAQAHWESRRPREKLAPRLDTSVRGLQDLRGRSLDDVAVIGAKAAQLAELMKLTSAEPECPRPVPTPPVAFAVPVVHGVEHFAASGARRILEDARAKAEFAADPRVRAEALRRVREAIMAAPVDLALLTELATLARTHFGQRRFRLRSSSNAEDLPTFSGAGLYTSISAALDDPERRVEDGLRVVWASLWSERAWDEREAAGVDQTRVAMAVLIHEAYAGVERANGVIVSRDVRNPLRSDVHYMNAQAGEASVTNPAPGVVSEELTYQWWTASPITVLARSSLIPGPVLTEDETRRLGCFMRAIHTHYRARLDPQQKNRWFTMEAEFKFVGPDRAMIIKQARPYAFAPLDVPADCREL